MKPLLLLLLCSCFGLAYAQAPATWGSKLGMNLSLNYGTKADQDDYQVKTGLRPGFIGGMYVDFIVHDNLSLAFEALYSMKGSKQDVVIHQMELDGVIEELERPATMKVKYYLDYLEAPVLLKLKTLTFMGMDITTIAGTAMSVKLKGYHELEGKVFFPDGDGEFSEIKIWEESKLDNVNMFDFSFVYGGAVSLQAKYPMSLEYRFTLGWDYIYLPTYQFFEPVALRNQTWSVLLSTTF